MVERLVLLRTIDSLWVEHLTELDDMRRGIGLRGYAQQDPLNEFRREAFRLYEELRGLIRHGVASTIFRVTVTRSQAPPATAAIRRVGRVARARSGRARAAAAAAAGAARQAAASSGGRRSRPRRRAGGLGRRCAAARRLPVARTDPRVARRRGPSRAAGGSGRPAAPDPGYTPSGARIGRNDPCWCGSGAKYKKCHGR